MPQRRKNRPAKIAEEAKKQEPSLDDTAAQPPEESEDESDDPQAEAEREKERRRALQQRFWLSAIGFWKGGDRLAWPLTIGLFVLVLLTVAAQYGINVWNRAIFDGLEKRDAATVFTLALIFFPLAATSVGLGVDQRLLPHDHAAALARLAFRSHARCAG